MAISGAMESLEPLEDLIMAARGETEVDLLIEGLELINALSGEVRRADAAIHRGRAVGFDCSSARKSLDLSGSVLTPGFIDRRQRPPRERQGHRARVCQGCGAAGDHHISGGPSRDCQCPRNGRHVLYPGIIQRCTS